MSYLFVAFDYTMNPYIYDIIVSDMLNISLDYILYS
nr:MAG TPA: hypothetical protein [Caudoviricetes sp.]DAK65398.1 MAG TPA: hypothetical protein [Caudoviricetes sp.]DAQ80448.1 MAG TPA: hypothetical protein [Herelleviridae sp.]